MKMAFMTIKVALKFVVDEEAISYQIVPRDMNCVSNLQTTTLGDQISTDYLLLRKLLARYHR